MKPCIKCYSSNDDNDIFCTSCGVALGEIPQEGNAVINKTNTPQKKLGSLEKIFIVIIILFFIGKISSNGEDTFVLSQNNKVEMCKRVIAKHYYKSIGIIRESYTSAQDSSDIVRVEYTRNSDNSLWRFACQISSNTIVYNTWQNDLNDWGRWRYDEENTFKVTTKEDGTKVIDIY